MAHELPPSKDGGLWFLEPVELIRRQRTPSLIVEGSSGWVLAGRFDTLLKRDRIDTAVAYGLNEVPRVGVVVAIEIQRPSLSGQRLEIRQNTPAGLLEGPTVGRVVPHRSSIAGTIAKAGVV